MHRRANWIVCLGICLIVVALGAAVVLRLRDTANCMLCANNLRMLAIAAHNYHNDFSKLPPAVVPHESIPFEDRLGWPANLWPYMSASTLRIDTSKSWHEQVSLRPFYGNKSPRPGEPKLHSVIYPLEAFLCPTNPDAQNPSQVGLTHYVGITGIGSDSARLAKDHPRAGIFAFEDRDVSLKFVESRDGLSSTLFSVETCHDNGPWMAGGRPTVRGLDPQAPLPYLGRGGQFSALHYSGGRLVTNVVFADCSTRSFTARIDPKVFEALATMAGGETVPSSFED